MNKKRVLKITPILITLNILVLFAIAGFYTFRLIKYYKLENGKRNSDTPLYLVDEVKKKRSYLDDTKGLVLDEETGIYRYKGEVDDNYIYYSGLMYRIIEVDKDGNIRAISEDGVTLMYPGFDKGYKDSYVNKWLNKSDVEYSGVFESTLVNSEKILADNYYCANAVTDLENIECEETNDYKITLLSLYDYKESGGKSSFINNGTMFNLGSLDDKNDSYFITEDGDIALKQNQNRAIVVRPVITINGSVTLIKGEGSEENPYIIEKHDISTLGDTYVGNIIKIDDYTFKVVEVLDDKVKVVSTDVLMKDEENELKIKFGGSSNVYSTSNTVGKYLNDTFLNSLSLKDSVVKGEFYTGLLDLNSLDYTKLRNEKVKAKVGMLTMGDMFINETNNTLSILRGMEDPKIIYVINENGSFFGDTLSAKYFVRPAMYLKSDLEIVSGNGTIESPYELGAKNEEGQN